MNKGIWLENGEYKPENSGGIYVSSYKRGRHTYGDPVVMNYLAPASLTIGDYCSIADGCEILLGGEHHTEFVSTFPFNLELRWGGAGYPHTHGDVVIGNDVFIGRNVTILSGVEIGNGAVIGAGSVVSKDVEPYSVAVGSPAKHVRYRFSKADRDKLRDIKWWNWHEDRVKRYVPLLMSGKIDEFIREAYVL